MKFLCLPGAYGSAKNFKVQLGPLAEELESRGLGTFTYSQGIHEVTPPTGWEDYFGSLPLYRFLDTSRGDAFETLRRLRHVPHGMRPEDTMRAFQAARSGQDWHQRAWREAMDSVFKTIDEDPEIDAIIGYSEGAMVGASLIVEEGLRCKRSGAPRRIKFAIFISGAPPLKIESQDKIVAQLVDESGIVIDIPTFHIFGCEDAFLSSAVALFNVCDQDSARMYDHGLGHIVPRDAENVGLLSKLLQDVVPKVEDEYRRADAERPIASRPKLIRSGSETDEELVFDLKGSDFTAAMLRSVC
ncbi:serine hydrolase-domain-containing protein [Lasiosphaeria miniovina]|uniref:Serine hydrolase-domain-containing protein n=1 Tax=Lasiosphaeria miniovina TaxID=1954250 RepID=A0AA40AE46_9PEZI|nr:serine hydrolase-domain-containing protein [Lasiosphaeria miniovina]KAK0714129.1 serine hydrolase-domain-containing protein [Lasiosphaeria miniovina]